MAELPVLGLRVGKEISPVHDRVDRKQLLTNPEFFSYRDRNIEDIWGMLQEHLQLDLSDLIGNLRFDRRDIQWRQLYHQNALSALFIGSAPEKPREINQSRAILEVISEVKGGRVQPQELALSGAVTDSKGAQRIIAIGYNLKSKAMQRVGISLAVSEIPKIKGDHNASYFEKYEQSFRPIPNTLDPAYLHRTRAIITPAMVEQTANHEFIVEAGPISDGKIYFDHPSIKEAGFNYFLIDNSTGRIGFQQSWHIIFATQLL